jgi:hypothetical protein
MTPRHSFPLLLAITLALGASLPASAEREPRPGSIQAVRATVESALTVTGTIDVDAAGNVVAWSLDQPEKLPPEVVKLATANVPKWSFEPVTLPDGMTVSRMHMSMLFVAREVAAGQHRLALRHPSFRAVDAPRFILAKGGRSRTYPPLALKANVTGKVFVVVRIDRTGKVTDALVEQVNLGVVDREPNMVRWRKLLGDVAVRDALKMEYRVPEDYFKPNYQEVVARVVFGFYTEASPAPRYGEWSAYVPGPRAEIPWREGVVLASTAPDSLPPDTTQTADPRTRRLKPTRAP